MLLALHIMTHVHAGAHVCCACTDISSSSSHLEMHLEAAGLTSCSSCLGRARQRQLPYGVRHRVPCTPWCTDATTGAISRHLQRHSDWVGRVSVPPACSGRPQHQYRGCGRCKCVIQGCIVSTRIALLCAPPRRAESPAQSPRRAHALLKAHLRFEPNDDDPEEEVDPRGETKSGSVEQGERGWSASQRRDVLIKLHTHTAWTDSTHRHCRL